MLIYNCMNGDATLFSRTDLVETAWRIAQPMLDVWKTEPADFPNYAAGTWGPKAAFELIERDGRKWAEILNRETLEKVPLFEGADAVLLASLIMALKSVVFQTGDLVIRKGEIGRELYLISRGEVEVIDGAGNVVATLGRETSSAKSASCTPRPETPQSAPNRIATFSCSTNPISRACCGTARIS